MSRHVAAARGRLTALGTLIAVLLVVPAPRAQASTARDPQFQPNLEATVRYLQKVQHEDGSFAEPGRGEGSDFTAWVTLALAAAGINPRDQATAPQHWVDGHSAYNYLAGNAHEASLTTDFERELLVVDAAGTSPHDFGGVDLVDEILKRQLLTGSSAGSFTHEAGSSEPGVNDTIFAILSLSPIHEPAVKEAVDRATRWLEAQEKCDGSWNWSYEPRLSPCNANERRLLPEEDGGEIDMTGAALQAVNAVESPGPGGHKNAFEYLREGEGSNGGFVEFLGEGEPNVASTAWVVQAMWSEGINPETWIAKSGSPLGYLASMQQPDGHIRYAEGEEVNGMWMTAYATPAFTGNALPISEVPYEPLPLEPPNNPEHASGSESPQPSSGVISGGGGNGAPLFSRPQPASKGHTPGGARQLEDQHKRTTTPRRNPGPARKAPAATTTSISGHHSRKHSPANHKGPGGVGLAGTEAGGGGQGSGREVKGLLVGAPADALEPGAPGLRGAQAGESHASWLTSAILTAALALALLGAFMEVRRPQVTL